MILIFEIRSKLRVKLLAHRRILSLFYRIDSLNGGEAVRRAYGIYIENKLKYARTLTILQYTRVMTTEKN